jgi:hypothetical protein
MIKKVLLAILMMIQLLNLNNLIFAEPKPIFVLGTIRFDKDNEGVLVPEIAVDDNGIWRKANTKDLWLGQEFQIFDRTETPKLQGKVKVNSLTEDFYALFVAKNKPSEAVYYRGIYKSKKCFRNIGKGIDHKPENLSEEAQKEFLNNQSDIKKMLQNVVKQDWDNIKKDFLKLSSTNISELISSDINGDKKEDYILILSNLPDQGGAAVIIYLTDGTQFKRIPVSFWENVSYDTSWPRILFVIDFNGDGKQEVVISESDSDINIPIIYGWIQDKGVLMELYHGEEEFWNG